MAEKAWIVMSDGPMDGRGRTFNHAVVVAEDYDDAVKIAGKAGYKIDNRRYYLRDEPLLRAA